MKTEQWIKHLSKADHLGAARVFLAESRTFNASVKGLHPNSKSLLVKHKEYVRKVDAELRKIGWTFIEYRNYKPSSKEHVDVGKLALSMFNS